MKKITAALLLMAMLVSMAACGNTEQTVDTTADTTVTDTTAPETEETRAMHAIPEELDFGGASFHVNALDWQGYRHYFFADEATGDTMNDAIFSRKIKTEEYLNIAMSQEMDDNIDTVSNKIKSSVMAGDDVYAMSLIHCIGGVENLASTGMLYNMDDLPYIDMNADWWNKAQTDVLRLGKNTYYGVSDYMIPCPYVVFFNKEMIVNNGMENPYDLVYEGKWTLDKFVDMAISVTQDLNGDGQFTMDDIVGVTCNEISKYIPFMTAADQFITKRDTNNRITLDLNNEKSIHIIETVYRMVANNGTVYKPASGNDDDQFKMESGRLLFLLNAVSGAENLRDCEVDIGILPYPKYDEEQENYISQDWGGLMCVPSSIQDPEMVGATLEYLAWESGNEVIPAYYDITLSGKLSRDEDSRKMLELLFDTIAYEIGGNYFGFSSGFGDLFYTLGRLVVTNGSTDFASWYAKNEKAANNTIDKFYEALEKTEQAE